MKISFELVTTLQYDLKAAQRQLPLELSFSYSITIAAFPSINAGIF